MKAYEKRLTGSSPKSETIPRPRLVLFLIGLLFLSLSLPVGAVEVTPASINRTVELNDTVNQNFAVTTELGAEVLSNIVLTEKGVQSNVPVGEGSNAETVNYSVTIDGPHEHCSSIYPADGVKAEGQILDCEFGNCITSGQASVNLTFIDPLTVAQSSFTLRGAPGETVQFQTVVSGGRTPYQTPTSGIGATVNLGSGGLSYSYSIPSNAAGSISDSVVVNGQTTSCGGDSATISVTIEVDPALSATPPRLDLQGAPGQQVQGTVTVFGGVPPYQASASGQRGDAAVNGSTVTYSYRIPGDAAGRLNDVITVKDAAGEQINVPVKMQVSNGLSLDPSELDLPGAPGQQVQGTVAVSGGVPPYQASASGQRGDAAVNGGTVTYTYTIPNDASGALNDIITVQDAVGETLTAAVTISVTAPVAVNPSPIELTALSLVNATTEPQKEFNVSGGAPPYSLAVADGGRGTVEPSQLLEPGKATYRIEIPANEATATTLSDTILVTDATGTTIEVPATVAVAASNTLSSREGLSKNQRSVARAIETVCPQLLNAKNRTRAQDDLLNQCSEMLSNPNAAGIPNAMGQITDEKVNASKYAGFETGVQQLGNIGSRLIALRNGSAGIDVQGLAFNVGGQSVSASQVASMVSNEISGGGAGADGLFGKWGFFLTGTFNFGNKDTTANETGFDFDTAGITSGVDYRFADDLVAGAAIGYAKNNTDFDSNGGGLDSESWHLAAYGSYYLSERTYIDAIVEYGWHDYDASRNIQYKVASTTDLVRRQARADYNGNQLGAELGAGYDIADGPLSYGIYGRAGYVKVDVDSFSESGAGGLNLAVDGFDATSVTTTLGGRVSHVFNTTKAVITPQLRFEWEHEYDDDATQIAARFAADPLGTSFGIFTDSPDRDYFRLGLAVSAVFPNSVSAFINYDTLLNKSNWTDHLIDAGVRWEF